MPERDVGLILRPLAPETKVKSRAKFTHIVPSGTYSFKLRFFIFFPDFFRKVLPHSYQCFLLSILSRVFRRNGKYRAEV